MTESKGIPATIKFGSDEIRVMDGYITKSSETVRPENKAVEVSMTFRITHLDHFCIKCGRQGRVRLLGTFISPVDGAAYPYAVCPLHEPVQEAPDED
jgi:hypothetical protein